MSPWCPQVACDWPFDLQCGGVRTKDLTGPGKKIMKYMEVLQAVDNMLTLALPIIRERILY
jgi:hypothetical protein